MIMKNRLIDRILQSLFPPRCIFCGEPLADISGFLVCGKCLNSLPYTKNHGCFVGIEDISYIVAPFAYIPPVSSAIKRLKFAHKRIYAETLASFLCRCLSGIPEINDIDLVIPVPLSENRLRERGFNQAELIAACVAHAFELKLDRDILIRTRDTKQQSRLQYDARVFNVHNAFGSIQAVEGKRILLVDDVFTTGSTALNCARALINAGASKTILACVAKGITATTPSIYNNPRSQNVAH